MSSSGAIRSNTVIDLCHKLDLVPTKSLHIHFVGAEKLEFGNQSQLDIIHLYEPFFQECRRLSVEELHLTFIGPSILPSSSTQASSFVFDGCLNVMVEYVDEVYHNFMDSPKRGPAKRDSIDQTNSLLPSGSITDMTAEYQKNTTIQFISAIELSLIQIFWQDTYILCIV